MSRNLKLVLFLACAVVTALFMLRLCQLHDRSSAGSYQLRNLGGIARIYVFEGYQTGAFQNLAVSNIPSLHALTPPRDDGLRDGIKRYLTDCGVDPATGEEYVFSPVTPAGEVLYFVERGPSLREMLDDPDVEQKYFWAWLPRNRMRHDDYIFLTGHVIMMTSDEVSWYYQTRLSDLSPSQLTIEIQHRAAQKLPPLSNEAVSNYYGR